MTDPKKQVHDFWNEASCGEQLLLDAADKAGYVAQLEKRYALEPYIEPFAKFPECRDRDVLEIGIGLGADHQRFAQAGARLTGIDLTERAVVHTRKRFDLFGLKSELRVGDAEALPFPDGTFDVVYSWGVLHHSPNTARAVDEALRVLRPGGKARIMIYHKHSLVGTMLWLRYALLRGNPWRSLKSIYSSHLESPGTKAYTKREAGELFRQFSGVKISTVLTHGDLLESGAGQRHRGCLLSLARVLWPRPILRLLFPGRGLFMLVEATK
ncbi:MAG: class I SAM-dependent methyltransferase [Planctomycetota bacterium]